jgi:hypothetical protein
MSTIFERVGRQDPDKNRGTGVAVVPLNVNLKVRLAFFVLLGAVSFLLLIACSNVANLVLAEACRASVRWRFEPPEGGS